MTETFYRTGFHNVDHTTYGGELTIYDFEGKQTLASMASKILNDHAFDKRCKINIEFRNRSNTERK